jgi:Amt family ammonium transporter
MLMIPGLAFFYGGMVHSKNVLSSCMHSFFALGLLTIQWTVLGYSLAFGESMGGFIGGFNFALLEGVDLKANGSIPHLLFMAFQMMFAIITPALISGAFAERIKFSAYALFTVLWATFVYDPVCHWVWNSGGWLFKRGAMDFAGGTVVHLTSGVSALVFAFVLGKRKHPSAPGNLPLTLIGTALLWFGWFGFNAGSALASNGTATLAFVNTHIAAAAAGVSWGLAERFRLGKFTMLGVASGMIAGLVVITPAAGFVGPMSSLVMGLIAGVVCFGAVLLKHKFNYDDALDAFGIHGVGGALGAVLTGVFAAKIWNEAAGKDGLIAGDAGPVIEQLIAVAAAGAYAVIVTFVLLKIIDATVGLRVDAETEHEGLDAAIHGESAYRAATERGSMEADMEPAPIDAPPDRQREASRA